MSEPGGDSPTSAARGDGGDSGVPPQPAAASYRGVAIVLAAALLLFAGLAATAPFWAASLPWAPPVGDPRIDQIEQALQQIRQDQAAAAAARQQVEQRVAALAEKPASPPVDTSDLRQKVAKLSSDNADLASQFAALDKTVRSQQQASSDLAKHVAAIDQAVQAQAKTGAELTDRVETLEKAAHRQAASGSSETAIVFLLLQIRDALAAGRPFATEYDALIAAAQNRPRIVAAASPLAAPAKAGVASRQVLAARLHRLAPAIEKVAAPEPDNGWTGQLLARLGGLVRVHRVDGAGAPSGDGAAVDTAEKALAGGDLAASIAAIERLGGAAADKARPWLDAARERLAAERALRQVEAALTGDLGAAAAPPAAAGSAR